MKKVMEVEKINGEHDSYEIRLPGFITEREVGLGDVIKRATSTFGIKPCGGCLRRADKLNSWLKFSGRGYE
jgi:hypothetical protein